MSSSTESTQVSAKTFFLEPHTASDGTLLEQTRNELAHWRGVIPKDHALMDKLTDELVASGIEKTGIQVGDKVPEFVLPNANGQPVASRDLLSQGAIVLAFYRGPWCPYCNLALRAYQKALPEIQALGGSLVAVAPTLPDNSLLAQEKNELTFPVLSDVGQKVARQFGIVWQLPEELWRLYIDVFDLDLAAFNGDRDYELPMPATFVLAQDGTVIYRSVNADYTLRAEPSEILDALRKLNAN